jgi:tRNA threonylcarbamoyl adenosine modification protein YeaZ
MAILAIDTSMAACSAAILPLGSERPMQRFAPMARGHAEELFAMIEAVMAEADCDFSSFSKIAVTLGPGSFTGVRAGLAAARGFALAAGLPIVGANSLEVMAQGCLRRLGPHERSQGFAVVHDARREECYAQAFDAGGQALGEPGLFNIGEVTETLPPGINVLVGTAAIAAVAAAGAKGAANDFAARLPDLLPEAADLARIAVPRAPLPQPPAPLYLRPADAKPQTDKSLARAE